MNLLIIIEKVWFNSFKIEIYENLKYDDMIEKRKEKINITFILVKTKQK